MGKPFGGYKDRETERQRQKEYRARRKLERPDYWKYTRKDAEAHKDYTAKWYRNWREQFPEKAILKRAKERARDNNFEFNLDLLDIHIPKYCPILNIKLEVGEKYVTCGSPTLDRIDNTKGYIKGNVHVISHRANRLKSDASFEEIEKLYNYFNNMREPTCS